jgi:hypothetical protein
LWRALFFLQTPVCGDSLETPTRTSGENKKDDDKCSSSGSSGNDDNYNYHNQ